MGRSPDHRYYRLVLDDGTVLETRISHSSKKTMSQGRWRAILRDQLGVSDEDFWKSLRDKRPVERPSGPPLEEEIEQIPLWAAELLTARLGMSLAAIAQLGRDRAIELARETWAKPTT
ncbi:MAG: cytotoxic translational repressor of toxin-antitoxin stability system [Candidatus Dormibacteria bacterium]